MAQNKQKPPATEPAEKRPRGRPQVSPEKARSATIRVRVTPAQAQKFEELGGADWIRAKIDRTKVPAA